MPDKKEKDEEQGTIVLTSKPTPIEFDRDDFTVAEATNDPEIPIPNQDTSKPGSPEGEKRSDFESDELRENSTKRPEASIEAEKEEFEKQGVVPEGAEEEAEDEEAKSKARSEAGKKAAATRKRNEEEAAKVRSEAAKKAAQTRAENAKSGGKK